MKRNVVYFSCCSRTASAPQEPGGAGRSILQHAGGFWVIQGGSKVVEASVGELLEERAAGL